MTVKKLKKIKDPETLLHKAVLMNNILECMRNYQNIDIQRNIDADTHSNYSQDEEEILRRIRLPHPITPISDHSFNEKEQVTEKDILDKRDNNVVEKLSSNSVEGYSKRDCSEDESIVNDKDACELNSS